MKHILFDLFLVSLGAGIGVTTMCFLQAGSSFDRSMEEMERSKKNEFRTEHIYLVSKQCTVACANSNRGYRGIPRI